MGTNDRRSERGSKERKDHGSAREKTERKVEKGYTRRYASLCRGFRWKSGTAYRREGYAGWSNDQLGIIK